MNNLPFEIAAPESLGIPSGCISEFVKALNGLDQAHSFILIRHGKIASAGEWAPYSVDLPHELFSLSKSFVSCAIGIAQSEKRLSIHDRLIQFFPEYDTDVVSPVMRRATLRNLLTMASGHDRCSFSFVDFKKGDWIRKLLESPLLYEPGERFVYNSGATFLLGAVIRKVTGQNVSEYLQDRLFEPMGMGTPEWNCTPDGLNIGGWGLWLPATDIAKFAQMLLQKGVWNGRQLVPADYLAEATAFQIDNSMNDQPDWKVGYGYQFWQCRCGGFRGDGASGQYAVVYPEKDLVFAFNSGINGMQEVLTVMENVVLPALSDTALPPDPDAVKALRAQEAALTAHLPEEMNNAISSGTPDNVSGTYLAPENPWNVKTIRFDLHGDACQFTMDDVCIAAGFREPLISSAPLGSFAPHKIAARAAWIRKDTLMIYAWCLQTTSRFTFTCRFEDGDVTLHRTTPILFHGGGGNIVVHARKQA